MKATNSTLNALLASRQFYAVDLYTIGLVGGTVLRYCQGQQNIIANTFTFLAGDSTGPFFDRKDNKAKVTWKLGVGTDTLVIDVVPGTSTILGQPFLSAVHWGFFDGAQFKLERAFMPTYGNTSAGTVIMFLGRIAEVDAGRSLATFTINDYRELLSQAMPRNLFQAGCVNTFGDTSCTINQASFAGSGITVAGSTQTALMAIIGRPTAYFDNGKFTFTSGVNNGLTFATSTWVVNPATGVGTLTPTIPIINMPAAGDTFTAYAGCDRSLGPGGCPKFSNTANYRGFPYTPAPETAL